MLHEKSWLHVTRLTTIGELTASIAHEVNQPLGAVVANANACLRWLNQQPPKLAEAQQSVRQIIVDGNRGSDVSDGNSEASQERAIPWCPVKYQRDHPGNDYASAGRAS